MFDVNGKYSKKIEHIVSLPSFHLLTSEKSESRVRRNGKAHFAPSREQQDLSNIFHMIK